MIDWILGFRFNGLLGICLYWVPLALCAYGYTVRTALNYQKDLKDRANPRYYAPTDTVGSLVWRVLATVMPVINLWAALVDVAPQVFSRLFRWLGRLLDKPLVAPR